MKLRWIKDQPRASVGDEFIAGKEQAEYLIKHKIAEMVDENSKELGIQGKDTREVAQPEVQYVPKNVDEPKTEEKPSKPIEAKPAAPKTEVK